MIATMAGRGVPVLEMFARFDAENPAPASWDLWGNQAVAPDQQDGSAGACAGLPETGKGRGDTDVAAGQPLPTTSISYELVEAAASDSPSHDTIAVAPVPIEPSEFEALKMLSDFCHPKRSELLPQIAPTYAERGLAIQQSATGQWMLRDTGWARLHELEAERKAHEPAPTEPHPLDIPAFLRREPKKPQAKIEPQLELALARIDRAPPEVVDGKLQTRMPINADDLAMQAALLAVDAGEIGDRELVRQAESEGYCTSRRNRSA
jgi:hypothetical protein